MENKRSLFTYSMFCAHCLYSEKRTCKAKYCILNESIVRELLKGIYKAIKG